MRFRCGETINAGEQELRRTNPASLLKGSRATEDHA